MVGALDLLRRGQELARDRVVNLEWRPPIKRWPETGDPLFLPGPKGALVLSSQMRLKDSGDRKAGVDLVCSLEDFKLCLIPGLTAMELEFTRLQFRQASGKKPEIDVILKDIKFVGPLSFIQTLKDVIPLDGFSDPPNVKVAPAGLEAGFSLALPALAVGIFSLENVAIGAALKVPFLGDAISLGFNFCTRENPFHLTVSGLGGGGFAAIELTPAGLRQIEVSLEFGAQLAINLGVVAGSVSVFAGIYFRLRREEIGRDADNNAIFAPKVYIEGFVRIRGEVDVLGLISASIELRLSLGYEDPYVIGRAVLEIEVSVLFFSTKVSIPVERRFCGANGDPTFAQMMGSDDELLPEPPVDLLAHEPAPWLAYCRAFQRAA